VYTLGLTIYDLTLAYIFSFQKRNFSCFSHGVCIPGVFVLKRRKSALPQLSERAPKPGRTNMRILSYHYSLVTAILVVPIAANTRAVLIVDMSSTTITFWLTSIFTMIPIRHKKYVLWPCAKSNVITPYQRAFRSRTSTWTKFCDRYKPMPLKPTKSALLPTSATE